MPNPAEKLRVDTRVTVETPEGVDFQFVIAGPGKRGMSFFIDVILKIGISILAWLLIVAMTALMTGAQAEFQVSGVSLGFMSVLAFSLTWLYGACFEAFWNGQTPGKRSQRLRVVRTNGTPVGWFEAFGRNLVLIVDLFPVVIFLPLGTFAFFSMVGTRRMQRLGDLVFDTMVIDESREFVGRSAGITAGVERIPRHECRGTYSVPERTLAVIERLFEGDRLVSDGRREEIGRCLSIAIRQRLGHEEPGPDPRNPNTFFTNAPQKHTMFLRRVLKTFAEDEIKPNGDSDLAEDIEIVSHASSRRLQDVDTPDVLSDDGGVAVMAPPIAPTAEASRASSRITENESEHDSTSPRRPNDGAPPS